MEWGGPISEVWGVVVAVAALLLVVSVSSCAWRSYARRRRLASALARLGRLGGDQVHGGAGWWPRTVAAGIGGTSGACLGPLVGAEYGLHEALLGGALAAGIGLVAGWLNVALATEQ